MTGAVLLSLFLVVVVAAPVLAPYRYDQVNLRRAWEAPSREYVLGTDRLGRDILSRVIYGSRLSLLVGVASTAVAVVIGVSVGALSGFLGGIVDQVAMRIIDIMLAFPALLFMILLSVVIGPGLWSIVFAIGITRWAPLARIVRAEYLRLRQKDFVLASRATGATNARVMLRHVLPNALGPIVVYATFGVPFAIVAEAGLGFIGLGVPPPNPSWGVMLNEGFRSFQSFPNMILAPSVALSLTMFGFIMFGNGLRDVLDPKTA